MRLNHLNGNISKLKSSKELNKGEFLRPLMSLVISTLEPSDSQTITPNLAYKGNIVRGNFSSLTKIEKDVSQRCCFSLHNKTI